MNLSGNLALARLKVFSGGPVSDFLLKVSA